MAATLVTIFNPISNAVYASSDPYLWLEEIEGKKAMKQVNTWNRASLAELKGDPLYEVLYQEALAVLTSKQRIPRGQIRGDNVYNFWQDDVHVRGIWRRASMKSYTTGEPAWETLLDIDALEQVEQQNWVYRGANCLPGQERCMVSLSRGGTDASVRREFSLTEKEFVKKGFVVPQAKSRLAWLDRDRLLISTDWGENTLTESGYPRIVKVWKRGTPLNNARKMMAGEPKDVMMNVQTFYSGGEAYPFLARALTFFEVEYYYLARSGSRVKLPVPLQSDLEGVQDRRAIVTLNEGWRYQGKTYPQGAVIAVDLAGMTAELIYQPGKTQAVNGVAIGKSQVFIQILDHVIGKIKRFKRNKKGTWRADDLSLPDKGVVSIASSSSDRDDLIVSFQSLTVPNSLYYFSSGNNGKSFMRLPEMFDGKNVVVEQRFASSKDGTAVPYFVMGEKDVLAAGNAPTIQYGYGGFLVPIRPVYYADPARPQQGALAGKLWVSRGGVLVLSNIRGGGEYGPGWHQAALKENRPRAFEDFFAIAEDLIASGVTTTEKLGAIGRSNGGLLMGVALTQRPDLYSAIDIGVPLFDMVRYDKLLAGASWTGEYGDPDIPAELDYILKYSPYQKLKPGQDYPRVFLYTSTRDDRVHPGHARKAAARLEEFGYDFYYYENTEGGHGGTANQEQLAMRTALEYIYFVRQLLNVAE